MKYIVKDLALVYINIVDSCTATRARIQKVLPEGSNSDNVFSFFNSTKNSSHQCQIAQKSPAKCHLNREEGKYQESIQ